MWAIKRDIVIVCLLIESIVFFAMKLEPDFSESIANVFVIVLHIPSNMVHFDDEFGLVWLIVWQRKQEQLRPMFVGDFIIWPFHSPSFILHIFVLQAFWITVRWNGRIRSGQREQVNFICSFWSLNFFFLCARFRCPAYARMSSTQLHTINYRIKEYSVQAISFQRFFVFILMWRSIRAFTTNVIIIISADNSPLCFILFLSLDFSRLERTKFIFPPIKLNNEIFLLSP